MLGRHLHLPHRLVCITEDARGIDPAVEIVPPPPMLDAVIDPVRCRRRMRQFDREFARTLGERIASVDLDVVIVDDFTPIVDRPDPIVCWRVGYAGVYCGSFVMYDAGALDGAWQAYRADQAGFIKATGERNASDQAMLNLYLRGKPVAEVTEADGFVSYFGAGYERWEHHGVGPKHQTLPRGARIVVLGSRDKQVMDEGRFAWIREHWKDAA